jgi:hypothetical protein
MISEIYVGQHAIYSIWFTDHMLGHSSYSSPGLHTDPCSYLITVVSLTVLSRVLVSSHSPSLAGREVTIPIPRTYVALKFPNWGPLLRNRQVRHLCWLDECLSPFIPRSLGYDVIEHPNASSEDDDTCESSPFQVCHCCLRRRGSGRVLVANRSVNLVSSSPLAAALLVMRRGGRNSGPCTHFPWMRALPPSAIVTSRARDNPHSWWYSHDETSPHLDHVRLHRCTNLHRN